MTWRIEFERAASREFRKLPPDARRRIRNYLTQRVMAQEDPRKFGKPLQGHQHQLWRYRVGNMRIVCQLQDAELVILIVRIAHRSRVYNS